MTKMANTDYIYFRQFGYDLFRRLLMEEPTPELLQLLQQQNMIALFPDLQDNPAFIDSARLINDYLTAGPFVLGEAKFDDLHWDFTRLFIGPEQPPAPPWESVYVSEDKLLFQHCTNEVKRIYAQSGFFLGENEAEAADHIGFELDFLYRQSLATAELFELPNADERLLLLLSQQLDFLRQHPLVFVGAFSENVIQHAETPFYRGFAAILPLFLTMDKRQIERSIAALKIITERQ